MKFMKIEGSPAKSLAPAAKNGGVLGHPCIKISPAAHVKRLCNGQKTVCCCFLFRGPGPSRGAGGGTHIERLKTLGPAPPQAPGDPRTEIAPRDRTETPTGARPRVTLVRPACIRIRIRFRNTATPQVSVSAYSHRSSIRIRIQRRTTYPESIQVSMRLTAQDGRSCAAAGEPQWHTANEWAPESGSTEARALSQHETPMRCLRRGRRSARLPPSFASCYCRRLAWSLIVSDAAPS